MPISDYALFKVWEETLSDFFEREAAQIIKDINERNLCGRMAYYLQERAKAWGLDGYYADPEYNRKQEGRVKTIINGQSKVVPITCDLILHTRGESIQNDNLIAVELKKSDRSEDEKQKDRERLMALTKSSYDGVWYNDGTAHPEHVCGYRLGVYLELDRFARTAILERYQGGERTIALRYAF